MTFFRLPFAVVTVVLSFVATTTLAQSLVPEQRYVLTKDVDFYGSDLGSLFDTTQSACERACTEQPACVGFTYNRISKACFPKKEVSRREDFAGAVSAVKIMTAPDVLARAGQRQEELNFLSGSDLSDARSLARQTSRGFYIYEGQDEATLSQELESAWRSRDDLAAGRMAARLIVLTDRAEFWARYAEIGARQDWNSASDAERELSRQSLYAAINAYLRTDNDGLRVMALQTMASTLEQRERGRDMVQALRLAYSIAPRPDIEIALDEATKKYGFRVVDHLPESDSDVPRLCAKFSERLKLTGVDYEPFVRVEGHDLPVEVEEDRLCITGVEHGNRYQVTIRKGLPAQNGEMLNKDVQLSLYVRDRSPSASFPGRAYVLPRSANAGLPIETVNVDTLDLTLRRISDRNLVQAIRESYFGQPLDYYDERDFTEFLAQEVWKGTGEVKNELNVDMTTRLPMGEALKDQPPGIFALSASIPGQDPYDEVASLQWFVLTDLGVSTWSSGEGMRVAVRSLGTAKARGDVTLTLISRANEVLGEVKTSADGFADFPAGLTRGYGTAAPALLMAEVEDDVTFLSLTDPAFDLSDRGVEGRPPSPPIDTFLTTDRGAYRAGETIYVTALTRDETATAINDLPVTAILSRPDGVEYARKTSTGGMAGGHVFDFPLGTNVPRGSWRLEIKADLEERALKSQTVLVEDFLPERLDFDIEIADGPLSFDQVAVAKADVQYLFGAPGSDLKVTTQVSLREASGLKDWPGYRFGRYDQRIRPRLTTLDTVKTDADGLAKVSVVLEKPAEFKSRGGRSASSGSDQDDSGLAIGRPLEAQIVMRVLEGSGRPVERVITEPVQAENALIGIKPIFDEVLKAGQDASFDLVAVGSDGAATPMKVKWTVNRVNRRYQWYRLYGNWRWEPILRRNVVTSGEVTLGAEPVRINAPTEWGEYELVVEQAGAPYAESAVEFYAGWYGGGGEEQTPDRLEMSLNGTAFDVGDTVQLRMIPEDAGVALISVLSNRVIEQQAVEVSAGENVIPLTVTEQWGSGAYVTATFIRPMDEAKGQNPARSIGLAHAAVKPVGKQLAVSIDAPEVVDGQPGILRAAVNVQGVKEGETAYVTLAAVDVGILNLTGFQAPDVDGHYFGQRRLGVSMRDVYGRLINGLNGAMGTVRSGGGSSPATLDLQSPPPPEETMAFFKGPVKVGPDGRAEIEIIRPAYNGSIRLMAVAWSDSAVGNADADVIARDPVVMMASLPRYLAPEDQSRMLLELIHAEGASGQMKLQMFADAGVALGQVPTEVILADKGSERLEIPLSAREVGDHLITISLTTPDGKELRKVLTMPVRSNDAEVAETRQFSLAQDKTFTFDSAVFEGFRPGTASATATVGPLARFDIPGLLNMLDRYPYGCTEQTTSGAMPLLYMSSLAERAGVPTPTNLDAKIGGAIDRILTRQSSNGGFGMWRAGSGNFWLDAYVTDFLSRARRQGYDVPDRAYSLAMDNLRNRVSYAPDFDDGGQDIAYALLVLAREGAASMADLRYYADTKMDSFGTPLAVAQLGAALASYGDQLRADTMFRRAGYLIGTTPEPNGWRNDFGTRRRDVAAVLKLTAEAGSDVLDSVVLANRISENRRRLSTQEAAQVLMAADALAKETAVPSLMVDGAEVKGTVTKKISDREPKSMTITNVSGSDMNVTVTTFGVPLVPREQGGYGYAIKRSYFDLEGRPISGDIEAGDRMVVVLRVSPFEKVGARLIIDDPLPGGLEIDNPRLLRSGQVRGMDWLKVKNTQNAEFRSDRFVAAVDHRDSKPFLLAYMVRAITPGTYHHPAAIVEDMYRPEYRANTETGKMTVLP